MGKYVKNGNSCIGCKDLELFPYNCCGCQNLKDNCNLISESIEREQERIKKTEIAPPNLTSELADGTALESSSDLSKAIKLLQRCADYGLNITCNNQLSEDVCLFLKHRT
jgi:hypothetical protein